MKILLFIFSLLTLQDINAQLPNIKLKNIDGKMIEINKIHESSEFTILSFFATWCHPCVRELCAIHELYQDWQEETGVKLVAISIDNSVNSLKVKPLVRSKGWEYEVLLDENGALKRSMNIELIPSVILLDSSGRIIWKHSGYIDGAEQEIYNKLLTSIQK